MVSSLNTAVTFDAWADTLPYHGLAHQGGGCLGLVDAVPASISTSPG
uniref:Uncharacterized protein n=1 Tax=blood disease bacterium R229 TaxID=741978 RepID=G2ZUJ8_9RALS|nr:hypothetical protein BDB_mp20036 [blood disease bacterium R229]